MIQQESNNAFHTNVFNILELFADITAGIVNPFAIL